MSGLNGLKLVAAQKPAQMSPVQKRRGKVAQRLNEQIELLRAQQTGTKFSPTRFRTITDTETGLRKQVEVDKRVKPWWFVAENGKMVLSVRYGSKLLELAKGKWAVEVGTARELLGVLEVLKTAVLDGELDAQIEAAAIKLREAFRR